MRSRRYVPAALRYGAIFAGLAVLLFLRRPDSLTNPQFFAEDGTVFFHDQVLFGAWQALFTPYAGYLLVVPRLVAFAASFFPIREAPLIYNFCALALAAVCCGLFSLPVFRFVVRSDVSRLAVCAVFAAGIDSIELVGTITNIQWYLQLAAILILLCGASRKASMQPSGIAVVSLLTLVLALSVPMLIVVVPLAVYGLWRATGLSRWIPAALVTGAGIQTLIYLAGGISSGHSTPAGFHGFFQAVSSYLAFRGVLASMIGRPLAMLLYARGIPFAGGIVVAAGLVWAVWLWRRAASMRAGIVVLLYLAIASSIVSIGVRALPRQPITFGGARYFYLAACCGVVAVAISLESIAWERLAWWRPAALLLIFSAGILTNFTVPGYVPLQWKEHAAEIEPWLREFRGGALLAPIRAPINPATANASWSFSLEGTVLANGGFEGGGFSWMPVGSIVAAPSGAERHGGDIGLETYGRQGSVMQLVLGLSPGSRMKASAMLFLPCAAAVEGALAIEDGRGVRLAAARPARTACAQWQKLATAVTVPPSRRLAVKLEYRGNGEKIYWDDVRLDPAVDRLLPSWGGVQAVPQGAKIASADWVSLAGNSGATATVFATPNPGLRPRYGVLSVGGSPFTLLQLGRPTALAPGVFQVAVFEPDCAAGTTGQAASDVLLECAALSGAPAGQVLMADWTGNGSVRLGVFRDGIWYLDLNGNGRWDGPAGGDGLYHFGLPGDIAVTGDWTGDGAAKMGIFRCPASGYCTWTLDRKATKNWDAGDPVYFYGLPGDLPVVGKWNPRDRVRDHIGVYRNGTWIVDSNGDGAFQRSDATYRFGIPGDIPVVAHSSGRIGVFRKGIWILDTDGDGSWEPSDVTFSAGRPSACPLLGEW